MMPDAELTSHEPAPARSVLYLRQLMSAALLAAFSYGFFEGRTYLPDAARLPVVVCGAGAVFAVLMLLSDFRQLHRKSTPSAAAPTPEAVAPDSDDDLSDIVREGVHAGDDALGLGSVAAGM